MKNIEFYNTADIPDEFKPIPASKLLPNWYKNHVSYISTDNKRKPLEGNQTSSTIKKCVPVFDAMTTGYLLLLPTDVYIKEKDGAPFYQWAALDIIQFHGSEQAETHPLRNGMPIYPKFLNHWGIKTPKGYSCLFTQPKHRDLPFTILDGIVDTDNYYAPVNFPFVLNDPKWEGLIPAGTPIAQVIPFKRDSFQMSVQTRNTNEITKHLHLRFFDGYKNKFWQKKAYK